VTSSDLSFTLWHLKCQVTVITCRKKVLAAYVIVVSDLVIGSCECSTALPTNSRSVVISLFAVCQLCHVLVVAKNVIYCFTFIHYVLIELFHYVRSTVHDRVGFILGVLAHSVACKATDLMLIYNICCFDIIDICTIIIMIVNGEGFKITDQVQCEAKPSRFVVKLCNTFFGVLGSGYLTSCGEWR